jgi:uncharacterized protein YbjQ (UPF0145 family)
MPARGSGASPKPMRFAFSVCLLIALLVAPRALARDEIIELPFQPGVLIADSQGATRGMTLRTWDGTDRAASVTGGHEITASKRTRRRGNDVQDCHWALAAAIKELTHDARAMGADTILDVRSNWKNRPNYHGGFYECALGGLMVGVAVRATAVVRQAPASTGLAASSAKPAPTKPGSVLTTSRQGKTAYELMVGNPQVSIKLTSMPEQDPERVALALTFRVEPGTKDVTLHKTCNMSAVAGDEVLTLAPPTYERGAEQETLFSSITIAQLRLLAVRESALLACETRVNLKPDTRQELAELLKAVDAHPKAAQAAPPPSTNDLTL